VTVTEFVVLPQRDKNTFVIRDYDHGSIVRMSVELTEEQTLAELRARGHSDVKSAEIIANAKASGPVDANDLRR
jgi:hypothetical protein